MKTITATGSANSDGASSAVPFGGGAGMLTVASASVMGGATVTVQWCDRNSAVDADWTPVTDKDGNVAALATAGYSMGFTQLAGYVRAVVSSAGATTSIVYALGRTIAGNVPAGT